MGEGKGIGAFDAHDLFSESAKVSENGRRAISRFLPFLNIWTLCNAREWVKCTFGPVRPCLIGHNAVRPTSTLACSACTITRTPWAWTSLTLETSTRSRRFRSSPPASPTRSGWRNTSRKCPQVSPTRSGWLPPIILMELSEVFENDFLPFFIFAGSDKDAIFVKFFGFHQCYDLIPTSAKLVVFDTQVSCLQNAFNFRHSMARFSSSSRRPSSRLSTMV